MAWTNGNKRWTVQFKSLNGTTCRIDIYKRGYTGTIVDTLTAAANPINYSEDNDSDLLNNVIRFRTGYLRLIENNYNDLIEIYPSVNTDRYVEFYYGETLDFVGFIQAQEFETPWNSGPRVVELPIISPMGLASGTVLDYSDFNPPRWLPIYGVIRYSLDALAGGYTGFIFPQYLPHIETLEMIVTDLKVNSLTICPFGNTYNKNGGDTAAIYEAKTVKDALEMVCTGFGLILHDVPGNPIFQRLDYTGDYFLKLFDGTRSRQTQTTTDLTAIASVASAENTESLVMPLSKIEVTYDGSQEMPEMTFERCRGYSRGCALEGYEFCTNSPNIDDFDGIITTNESIDNNGLTSMDSICLGAFGSGSLEDMIVFRPAEDGAWGTGKKICSCTFFGWDGESARLQFKHQYGTNIGDDMTNPETNPPVTIAVIIKHGNQYFNSQANSWDAIPASLTYTKAWSDGRVDCEVGFLPNYYNDPYPLVVEFYAANGNFYNLIHTISDVRLARNQTAADEYLKKNTTPNKFTITGSPSDIEGSITRGCSILAKTSNRIRYNSSNVSGTAEVDIMNNEPTYPYLLTAQDRLLLDVKMTYQTAPTIYLNRMTLWGNSKKWRIIAREFIPWDDTHRITFHHSSIFDS
jgi:hypothetical protein